MRALSLLHGIFLVQVATCAFAAHNESQTHEYLLARNHTTNFLTNIVVERVGWLISHILALNPSQSPFERAKVTKYTSKSFAQSLTNDGSRAAVAHAPTPELVNNILPLLLHSSHSSSALSTPFSNVSLDALNRGLISSPHPSAARFLQHSSLQLMKRNTPPDAPCAGLGVSESVLINQVRNLLTYTHSHPLSLNPRFSSLVE